MAWAQLDIWYSIARLGDFQTVLCDLSYLLMHKLMCYLNTYPNKPLIFQKSPSSVERKIRVHWSANHSEDFTFQSTLESFQDSGGSSDKLLRTSYTMCIQMFCDTDFSWKIFKLSIPINSNDSEMRLICKSVVRVRRFRFLVTSLGFVYEDDTAALIPITDNNITPRIRHIDLPLACLCYEHTKEVF